MSHCVGFSNHGFNVILSLDGEDVVIPIDSAIRISKELEASIHQVELFKFELRGES
jgi:predicted esterase